LFNTVVAIRPNSDGQCNVSGWRDIGPVSEELLLKWKQLEEQARLEKERQAREAEQQKRLKKAWLVGSG